MMVRGAVPSLIQGISQQTSTLRPPGYIAAGINTNPTVLEGLGRKPGSDHVANLPSLVDPVAKHWINRDPTERYFVVADEGVLKVWDFTGALKTVNAPDGWSYVSGATSIGFRTINDYTFVYDRGKTVAMTEAVEPTNGHEAIFFIRQGDYATGYTVSVGYPAATPTWVSGTFTTSGTDAASVKIDNITSNLASSLSTALGSGWTVTHSAHVIRVKKNDGANFVVASYDGATGKNTVAIKGGVSKFSDLPTVAPNGFHVKINGDEASTTDDWFAKFVTTDPTSTGISAGVWKECPEPGTKTTLDATTMPHVLVREEDGTFTFRKVVWGVRVCGNEANNPPPSFVGREITDVSAKKGRVTFCAGSNWITSRPRDLFNFWQQSAQQLVDSDPVDISPSYDKAFTLLGVGEFQKGLILYAADVQFLITHGEIFGPRTIASKPLSQYDLDVTNGLLGLQQDRVVCALKRETHTGLMSFKAPNSSLADMVFDEASMAVPALMPGGAEWIAGSSTENVVVLKATGSDYLFAYKESLDQGKLIQSAWVIWEWKNRKPVSGTFVGPVLYLVLQDSEGEYAMERMSLQPLASAQLSWDIHVDRRIELVEEAFEVDGGSTTVSLPWTARAGETVLLILTEGPQVGAVVKASATGTNSATFPGLYAGPGVVGVVARTYGDLSTLYYRRPAPGGGEEVVTEGVLQLTRGKISYDRSGPFKMRVKPKDRTTDFATSIAVPLFEDLNYASPQDLQTGSTEFTIGAINDRVTISFDTEESPMPMRIGSFEWAGDLNLRARPL